MTESKQFVNYDSNEIKEKCTLDDLAEVICTLTDENAFERDNGHIRIGSNPTSKGSIDVSFDNGKAVWYDFAQGVGGTIVDAYKVFAGLETFDAIEESAKFLGIEPTNQQASEPIKTFDDLLKRRGYSDQEISVIKASGKVYFKPDSIIGFIGGKRTKEITFDSITGKRTGKINQIPYHSKETHKFTFDAQTIADGFNNSLVLVEGEFDAISASFLGFNAYACKSFKADDVESFKCFDVVLLAYDNDKAGDDYTTKAAKSLTNAIDIRQAFKDFNDIDDYHKAIKGNADKVKSFQDSVRRLIEHKDETRLATVNVADLVEVAKRYKESPCNELARVIEQDLPFTWVYDVFTNQIFWGKRNYTSIKDLRPFSFDNTMKTITCAIEQAGIKGGGNREDIKANIRELAEANKIDTAQAFIDEKINGISPFDVETFDLYADFLNCERSPFSKALSNYTLTGMWARAMNLEQLSDRCTFKGVFIKAMPVLVGDQNVGKSTAIKMLAMSDEYFTDSVCYSQTEGDWARELGGKLLSEFSELAGLTKADQNEIKARQSKTVLRYIPKYMNDERKFIRRDFPIMTTNEDEFLSDSTGSTRFAPIRVQSRIDLKRLEENAPKIWATAKALYEKVGNRVLFEDLVSLQADNNKAFNVSDPWDERVLAMVSRETVSTNDILHQLGFEDARITKREQGRVCNICKRLGFVSVSKWVGKAAKRVWVSNQVSNPTNVDVSNPANVDDWFNPFRD